MGSFKRALTTPSDIWMHVGLLHGLAKLDSVLSIVEIGFRTGVSAAAFCAAGKSVTSIDIDPCEPHVSRLRAEYPNFQFIQGDSRMMQIPRCDLLFIDGEHTYETVLRELTEHSPKVLDYIVLHDTETFADHGKDGSKPGLRAAIDRFLRSQTFPDRFERLLHLPHNNGLTILKREDPHP